MAFIFNYAFARAGGEQAGYSEIAKRTLEQFEGENIPPPEQLWGRFVSECNRDGKMPNERLNRGVITGLAALTTRYGNLLNWTTKEIKSLRRVEPILLELIKIKGISVKIASFILRDMVWLGGLTEEEIDSKDMIYLQPVDRWIRRVAKILWLEFNREKDIPELIIAKRLAEACCNYKISNIEFNQGTWFFASQVVKEQDELEIKLEQLD